LEPPDYLAGCRVPDSYRLVMALAVGAKTTAATFSPCPVRVTIPLPVARVCAALVMRIGRGKASPLLPQGAASPNAADLFPGRLHRRQVTDNPNAGTVNRIRVFGSLGLPGRTNKERGRRDAVQLAHEGPKDAGPAGREAVSRAGSDAGLAELGLCTMTVGSASCRAFQERLSWPHERGHPHPEHHLTRRAPRRRGTPAAGALQAASHGGAKARASWGPPTSVAWSEPAPSTTGYRHGRGEGGRIISR
jgi:hypothetical protein